MFVAELNGLPEALAGIKAAYQRKGEATARGLKKAGLSLQHWSQEVAPVDKGIMYGSAFTRLTKNAGFNSEVQVGYTTSYAIFVHENLNAAHGDVYNEKYAAEIERGDKGFHLRKPNEQAKFLENPAREHAQDIKDIVAREARNG
jgi:hypothetical protein